MQIISLIIALEYNLIVINYIIYVYMNKLQFVLWTSK